MAIEQDLRADLAAGRFRPGERLPGENELARRFGATRNTVRRALAELQAQGVLRIVHGAGTYVCEEAVCYELGERTRFSESLVSRSLGGRRPLLGSWIEPAGPEVATALALPAQAEVVVLEVLVEAEERVLGHGRLYFSAQRFRGIDEVYRRTNSISAALRFFGVEDYWRLETSVIARMPTKAEARLLRQARTQPVIEQTKIDAETTGDQPVSYGVSVYAGERMRFVVRRDGLNRREETSR